MEPTPQTKEEELLLRVFSLIKDSHFTDHKLSLDYLTPVRFKRGLGNDIGNFVQARFPDYYHAERRKIDQHNA